MVWLPREAGANPDKLGSTLPPPARSALTPALPEYHHLLLAVKPRVREAQYRVLQLVNHQQMQLYWDKLAEDGILKMHKQVSPNYYVNQPLFERLAKLG